MTEMNHEQRIKSLQSHFGYSPQQAEFLVLVAEHSGHFLRRQFGSVRGGPQKRLISALRTRRHVRTLTFTRTHLYHLASRPFYRAVGLEHSRNRRRRGLLTLKIKVMALDLVLARPGDYLATESDKLAAFQEMGVAPACLPVRIYHGQGGSETRRWFVDKFPLRLDAQGLPVFSFIDPGWNSNKPFLRHLFDYHRLLSALPGFRLLYVSDSRSNIERARRGFSRFAAEGPEELHELARLEDLFARKQIEQLGQKGLIRLRTLRRHFGSQGPSVRFRTALPGQFVPLHLNHDYAVFAPLSAGS